MSDGTRHAGSPSRRRLTAVGVLVVSCIALLATSPAIIESRLTTSYTEAIQLTVDAPRAVGRIQLSLSAEALPASDIPGRVVSGDVRFALPSEEIVLTVQPIGSDAIPYEEYEDLVFPIEQLCRVAEPCEREFEVALEWITPPQVQPVSASYAATLELVYHEVEENPVGATAEWSETSGLAPTPPGPVAAVATDEEQIVLDGDHWAASRHVLLTASEAARRGELIAFLDWRLTQDTKAIVRVTIDPDEPGAEPLAGEAFDPFEGCASNGECRRGLTVLFELDSSPAGSTAVVGWSLEMRSGFPAEVAVPDAVELSAIVDGAANATSDDPHLVDAASGRIELSEASTPAPTGAVLAPAAGVRSASVSVTIRANHASLPLDGFDGLPPTGRVSVTVAGRTDVAVDVLVRAAGGPEGGASVKLSPGEPEASVVLNPLRSCDLNLACTRTLIITATAGGPRVDPRVAAEVEWNLQVLLAYPGLDAVPPGAELEVTVAPEGG